MNRAAATAFLGLVALTAPALALEVTERQFQVRFNHDGTDYVFNDLLVPLLPGNSCFDWHIRFSETSAPIVVTERLTLPEAIDWGALATAPGDGLEILEGGTVAESVLRLTTDDTGWASHGWCSDEGDPLGRHVLEITADGKLLSAFAFVVMDPAEFSFPAAPQAPGAKRSRDLGW